MGKAAFHYRIFIAAAVLVIFYTALSYHSINSSTISVEELRTDLDGVKSSLHNRRIDLESWCSKADTVEFVDYQTARSNLVGYDWMYTSQYNLFYCSVPKAASTTMKKSLMESLGIKVENGTDAIHNQAILQLSLSQLNKDASVSNIPLARSHRNPFARPQSRNYSLIIVRDPYERLISTYEDKIVKDGAKHLRYFCNDYEPALQSDLERNQPSSNKTVPLVTFSDYINCVLSNQILKTPFYNDHIVPMSKLCAVCLIRYDIIVKMENFIPEMAYLLTQLDGDTAALQRMLLDQRRRLNPTKSQMSLYRQLSQTQLTQLKLMYRDDFELFGYSSDIPWTD